MSLKLNEGIQYVMAGTVYTARFVAEIDRWCLEKDNPFFLFTVESDGSMNLVAHEPSQFTTQRVIRSGLTLDDVVPKSIADQQCLMKGHRWDRWHLDCVHKPPDYVSRTCGRCGMIELNDDYEVPDYDVVEHV